MSVFTAVRSMGYRLCGLRLLAGRTSLFVIGFVIGPLKVASLGGAEDVGGAAAAEGPRIG